METIVLQKWGLHRALNSSSLGRVGTLPLLVKPNDRVARDCRSSLFDEKKSLGAHYTISMKAQVTDEYS